MSALNLNSRHGRHASNFEVLNPSSFTFLNPTTSSDELQTVTSKMRNLSTMHFVNETFQSEFMDILVDYAPIESVTVNFKPRPFYQTVGSPLFLKSSSTSRLSLSPKSRSQSKPSLAIIPQVAEESFNAQSQTEIPAKEISDFYEFLNKILREDTKPIQIVGQSQTTSISQMIQEFEKTHSHLVEAWKKGLGWKEHIVKDLTEKGEEDRKLWQESRVAAVRLIENIADVLAAREDIPHSEFADVGTYGFEHDLDHSIESATKNFADNALQGEKIVIANAVFRALYGSSADFLADANFYSPQIAKFLGQEVENLEARRIFSFASMMGSILQFKILASDKSSLYLDSFRRKLEERAKQADSQEERSRCNTTLEVLNHCIAEVNNFEETVSDLRNTVPKSEPENILAAWAIRRLSPMLIEMGKKIDGLENGKEKDLLKSKFYFYFILRERFSAPSGLYTMSYNVVCKNQGGQEHKQFLQTLKKKGIQRFLDVEKQKFRENSPQSLRDTVAEVMPFFASEKTLEKASKSGERATKAACALVNLMISINKKKLKTLLQSHSSNSHKVVECQKESSVLTGLQIEIAKHKQRMTILLAMKKKVWDEGVFITVFRDTFIRSEAPKIERAYEAMEAEKGNILQEGTPKAIFSAFVKKFQELYGLDEQGKKEFFNEEVLLAQKNPTLLAYLNKLSQPSAGTARRGSIFLKLGKTEKDELWKLMINALEEAFGKKQKESVHKIEDLAEKIFNQMNPESPKYFVTEQDKTLTESDLTKELSYIYCYSLKVEEETKQLKAGEADVKIFKEREIVKELFRLAESVQGVQKTQRVMTDCLPINPEDYARKELVKMKKDFYLSTEDTPEVNKNLLDLLQRDIMIDLAKLDALAFTSGLLDNPLIPESFPSYTQALLNPSSILIREIEEEGHQDPVRFTREFFSVDSSARRPRIAGPRTAGSVQGVSTSGRRTPRSIAVHRPMARHLDDESTAVPRKLFDDAISPQRTGTPKGARRRQRSLSIELAADVVASEAISPKNLRKIEEDTEAQVLSAPPRLSARSLTRLRPLSRQFSTMPFPGAVETSPKAGDKPRSFTFETPKANDQAIAAATAPSRLPRRSNIYMYDDEVSNSKPLKSKPLQVFKAPLGAVTSDNLKKVNANRESYEELSFYLSSIDRTVFQNLYVFPNVKRLVFTGTTGMKKQDHLFNKLHIYFPKLETIDLRNSDIDETGLKILFASKAVQEGLKVIQK